MTTSQFGSQEWLMKRGVVPADRAVDDHLVVHGEEERVVAADALVVGALGVGLGR